MLGGFTNDPDGLEIELGEPARKDQNPNQMIGAMKMQFDPGGEVMIRQRAKGVQVQKVRPGVRKGGPTQVEPAPEKKLEKAKD
jgi:hypothetical protein